MDKVLFVCLGNICRSPSAEQVFRQKVLQTNRQDSIYIDSAGISDWHIGQPPDERAQAAGLKRGYDLSTLRARQIAKEDFEYFDFIIAMDNKNLTKLKPLIPKEFQTKVHLLLQFHPSTDLTEVFDPYYHGDDGFNQVLDLIEPSCDGLLSKLIVR